MARGQHGGATTFFTLRFLKPLVGESNSGREVRSDPS
jgi:hypothetical protein